MLASKESIIGLSPKNSATRQKEDYSDEEESLTGSKSPEKSDYDVDCMFATESRYLQSIQKTITLLKMTYLDVQPSWDKMNIPKMTRKEFEMSVHANCIKAWFLNVEQFICRAGYLKHFLLNNGKILKMILCSPESERIIEKLLKPKKSGTFLSLMGTELNEDMANAFIRLTKNPKIENYINLHGKQILPRHVLYFKENLMLLHEVINPQLMMSAENVLERNKKLRKAWNCWKEKQITISALHENISKEINVFEAKMKARELEVIQVKKKINYYIMNISQKKDALMRRNESEMTHELESSEYKQEQLISLAKESVEKYQHLLNSHIDLEKNLRTHRFKIESLLTNWLTKFDTVMIAKQEELDEVIESSEKEYIDFVELQCLFNEQKHIYNKYKEQHDKEESEIFANRLYWLRANMAARTIQHCWRMYRQKKLSKKNLKKEKAKAKKEAAAAKEKAKI